jgi:hypothetical protein
MATGLNRVNLIGPGNFEDLVIQGTTIIKGLASAITDRDHDIEDKNMIDSVAYMIMEKAQQLEDALNRFGDQYVEEAYKMKAKG